MQKASLALKPKKRNDYIQIYDSNSLHESSHKKTVHGIFSNEIVVIPNTTNIDHMFTLECDIFSARSRVQCELICSMYFHFIVFWNSPE